MPTCTDMVFGGSVLQPYPIHVGSDRENRKSLNMELGSAAGNSRLAAASNPLVASGRTVQSWIDALKEPTKRSTVLAIDSHEGNRAALGDLLEKDGYRVLSAAGAAEALDILHRISVDLVILDMSLPD